MLSVGIIASSIWFVRSKGRVSRREEVFCTSISSWREVRDPLYESIKCLEAEEGGWGSTGSDYISAILWGFRLPAFQIVRIKTMVSDHSDLKR